MKLLSKQQRQPLRPSVRRTESGMAVIVVMGLIAILLIYVSSNARTLHLLGREVKLVEEQQTRRLAAMPGTNSPATGSLVTNGTSLARPGEPKP